MARAKKDYRVEIYHTVKKDGRQALKDLVGRMLIDELRLSPRHAGMLLTILDEAYGSRTVSRREN